MIIKRSGTRIADASWLVCDVAKTHELIHRRTEDLASCVVSGEGKPSIETFLHCLPARIVVHLHPSKLFNKLCTNAANFIPYKRPGLELAYEIFKHASTNDPIYLKNHGIILSGSNICDIQRQICTLQLTDADIVWMDGVREQLRRLTGVCNVIKPWWRAEKPPIEFRPYTPDIVVFLGYAPLLSDLDTYFRTHTLSPTVAWKDGILYTFGRTYDQCVSVYEIYQAYMAITDSSCLTLSDDDVNELLNWDKEKERRNLTT